MVKKIKNLFEKKPKLSKHRRYESSAAWHDKSNDRMQTHNAGRHTYLLTRPHTMGYPSRLISGKAWAACVVAPFLLQTSGEEDLSFQTGNCFVPERAEELVLSFIHY